MRLLVTGAGGFLGGHIARRLAESGFEVIASTRASPVEPPQSVAAARRFSIVAAELASDPLPSGIDAIVHAAASSAWRGISVDRMLTDNVIATQALVRHALAGRVRAFVFLSSISAFGTIRVPVLTESEPTINPDTYGLTKLIGEKLLEDVSDALPSLSIRLPAVIGQGSKRNWPSECLRKLKSAELLEAFNPNAPFNNVVHERDVAGLVVAALQRGLSSAETVLVGSDGKTTIAGVIRILAQETGSRSAVTMVERERDAFLIDWSKAANLFGFTPMHVDRALTEFVHDNP